MADLGKEFLNTIKKSDQRKTTPFDAVGTVTRVKDGIAYVHFAGGVDETPVKLTINAQAGDEVQVRVADGRAWLVGNATSPPTDDAQARRAINLGKQANDAAVRATKDAMVAHEAAESASKSAREAKETTDEINAYAETAGKTITQILSDGETAGTAAQQAKSAADTAVSNLSQVQEVLEVVEWVAKHGTYTKATTFNPNATYYTVTATQVTSPSDDDKDSQGVLIYYELSSGVYVRTTDTSVQSGKTYYTLTGTPVAGAKAEDIGQYYTLTVTDAMADYIQSHLMLTNEGLYVMKDGSMWKVRITDNGVYIIDPDGIPVNSMSANGNTVGVETETHAEITPRSFSLYANETVKYVNFEYLIDSEGYITERASISGPDQAFISFDTNNAGIEYLTVNGESFSYVLARGYGTELRFYDTPLSMDDVVIVKYKPVHSWAKDEAVAFTLGTRKTPSEMGAYSFSIGKNNHVESCNGIAIGVNNFVNPNGVNGIAIGYELQTLEHYQVAVGKYCEPKHGVGFLVGNGQSPSQRSNAFEVDWDGNVLANGDVEDGSGNVLSDKLAEDSNGDLSITRNIDAGGDITPSGQVKTSFKSSVAMGSYGSAQTTIPNFVDEVRYSSGCAGSVSIGTAYTKDGVTIPAGWYNFMYMPHRTGGKNGQVDPNAIDNVEYGNLILFGFASGSGRYDITVAGGAISKLVKLITSDDVRKSPTTSTHTKNVGKIAANTYKNCETNTITPTTAQRGLTPVVSGWDVQGTGTASCQIMGVYLSGNATNGYVGHIKLKNDSTSQIGDVTIEVRVLWV